MMASRDAKQEWASHEPPELCSIIKDKLMVLPEPQAGPLQEEVRLRWDPGWWHRGSFCPLSSEVPSPWHRLQA